MTPTAASFTCTSAKPYDQCYYVLRLEGGGHSIWGDYEEVRDHWMLNRGWGMTHIEVEVKKKKKEGKKGFS